MSKVSIVEVAKLAGVSIATVSRCINNPENVREKNRLKVQEAIMQLGYAPNTLAQSFRRGKTNVIMVVMPSVGDPFFTEVMEGIHVAAKANGYSIIINETQFNTMTADEIGALVVSRQVDGIILLASMSPFGNEVLSAHSNRALPMVIGCETITSELIGLPSVHIDNIAAAKEATTYAQSVGHSRIAFMNGTSSSLLTKDRESGYRAAMEDAGLAIEEGWVIDGDLTIDGAIRATRSLLAYPTPPTCIFCANDEMAIGALHEVKSQGLTCPDDISIIGFDDTRYAEVMDPPLTTVYQPAGEIGERTLYRLVKEIDGDETIGKRLELVPHKLIIRRSVAAPKS